MPCCCMFSVVCHFQLINLVHSAFAINLRGILDKLTIYSPDNTPIHKGTWSGLTAPLLTVRTSLLMLSLFFLGYLVCFLHYPFVTELFYPPLLVPPFFASRTSFLLSHFQVFHLGIFLLHFISSSFLPLCMLGVGVPPRTAHGYVYAWGNVKAKGLANFD